LLEDGASKLLGPIGLFGAVVTVGLFIYELRGIQRCHRLERQAKALERKLKLSEDQSGVLNLPPRSWYDMLGPPAASLIVYLAVVFAWLYVAGDRWWGPDRSYAVVKSLGLGVGYAIVLLVIWRRVRSWLAKTTGLG
jgi:hypothetical protein